MASITIKLLKIYSCNKTREAILILEEVIFAPIGDNGFHLLAC